MAGLNNKPEPNTGVIIAGVAISLVAFFIGVMVMMNVYDMYRFFRNNQSKGAEIRTENAYAVDSNGIEFLKDTEGVVVPEDSLM